MTYSRIAEDIKNIIKLSFLFDFNYFSRWSMIYLLKFNTFPDVIKSAILIHF